MSLSRLVFQPSTTSIPLVRGKTASVFRIWSAPQGLAAQIARQATVLNSDENFAVVFVAMGLPLKS